MQFAPTVATEINKMLLPRWGEFCCVGALPRAVSTADGGCPFRAQIGTHWECVKFGLLEYYKYLYSGRSE